MLRCLLEGLRGLHGWRSSIPVASKAGISQARTRRGAAPLECLFEPGAVPPADRQTPGAWYRGRRLVSLDGTTVAIADVPDDVAACGRRGFPQLRLVALTETGPRAMIAVAAADSATGETTLARRVIGALSADMLCLADRGFGGFAPWSQACATGAALLWRVRKNQACPQRLPDGSYLGKLYASSKQRRRDDGLAVRVIEYRLDDDVPGAEPLYRLITTLSDPATAPAAAPAALCHERWESGTAFAELKASLPGGRLLLRSKTPELVRQEFYGLLLAHCAIRRLMHQASAGVSWDPDHLSFIRTVRIVRRNLPFHAAFSPAAAP